MGFTSKFSNRVIWNKALEKNKSDRLPPKDINNNQSHKKISNFINDINYLVDDLFIKKNISLPKENNKYKYSKSWFLKPYEKIKILNDGKLPIKKFLSVLLSILLVFVAIASASIFTQPAGSESVGLSVSIEPKNIYTGEILFINVTVPNSLNISYIKADIADVESIDLLFDNSSLNPFWKGVWTCQDIDIGDYPVKITAVDNESTFYLSDQKINVITQNETLDTTSENLINETIDVENNQENETLNITSESQINETINVENNQENETLNITSENLTNETIDTENNQENETTPNLETNESDISNKTVILNQLNVSIEDPGDEQIYVLPGTIFYVERTVNGTEDAEIIFAPLFSDSLTIEKIEIVENKDNTSAKFGSDIIDSYKPKVYNSGRAFSGIEKKIEKFREKLPSDIRRLDKIAYSYPFRLQSPITVRVWFKAPSWEEIKSGLKPSFGRISYLTFVDKGEDDYDFESSTWWNSNWGYRKLVTINSSQVDADLTNFPILINITDIDLRDYAQNDGDDIAFVLYSDNTTQLNHEIERFNGTTGELYAWVNITSLSSSEDTKIWMYYNNVDCNSQENIIGVWNSNHLLVHHLNETSGTHYDSTLNGNNGTWNDVDGQGSQDATGTIDGANDFDGNDDYVSLDNQITFTNNYTLMFWAKRDDVTNGGPLGKEDDNDNYVRFLADTTTLRVQDSNSENKEWINTFNTDVWYHITITKQSNLWEAYRNGVSLGTVAGTYDLLINAIGDCYSSSVRNFDGIIDEVRISNTVRNSSWISTTYNTVINSSTFISIGSEEVDINTSVYTISPYIVTYSPFTINATGLSSLDNVTLYYRYSTDNSTWGSNVSWDNSSNPDTESPWEWAFNFTNGTGYYEFYSIGNKSGFSNESVPSSADAICFFNESLNTIPEIDLINPQPNGTTDVSRLPMCQVWANDSDGDTLTVYWYENTSESWILRNINNSVSADTIVSYTFTQFSNYSTTFWWKVAVNDSIDNTSNWFYFSTKPIDTLVDPITPYNLSNFTFTITATGDSELDNVSLWYKYSSVNSTWWNSIWTYRKKLTFDNSGQSENLVNFPVLINLSSSNFDYSKAKPDGTDLRFIDSDCVTELKYHIEKWNNSGYSYIWVNVTNIAGSSNADYIWMYYNNSDASNAQDESGTYDEYFDSVFHLDDFTGSTGVDATPGGDPTLTTGLFGDCYDFDSDDYAEISGSTSDNTFTLEVWAYLDVTNSEDYWYGVGSPFSAGVDNDVPMLYTYGFDYGSTSLSSGQWYYFVVVGDSSEDYYYVNAVDDTAIGSGIGTRDIRAMFGATQGYTSNGIDGRLDEFRVSNIARSADWIKAQYLSMNNSFITYGNENQFSADWNFFGTDTESPWSWNFDFPNRTGYYEFYSIGKKSDEIDEDAPTSADARCYNNPNTIVDPIVPYNRTTSPITINATGNSGFDNVTLYYRYSTDNSSWDNGSGGISWSSELVTNGGFESGDFTGWTTYSDQSGDWGVDDGEPLYGTHGAQEGSYSAYHSQVSGSNCYVRQDVDVTSYASDIDAGNCVVNASGWYVSDEYDASIYDISRVRIQFLNATKGVISTPADSGFDNVNVWTQESISNYAVPTNTRYIRMEGFTYETNWDSGSVDNFSVTIGTEEGYHWNEFGTDTESPWSWTFNFPNGTGYYEFYTVGNKSGWPNETKPDNADALCKYNRQPIITNEGPSNQSTGIPLTPQMNITVNDSDGESMTINWYSNSSGSWQVFGTNSSVGNGTYHQINANFTSTGKTYWWYVTVDDELDINTSAIFHFTTTETAPPQVTSNASTGVEETNATLWGYLYDEGGESCTGRFEYGTNTSYGTNTTNQTISEGEEFSAGINSLTPGQLYHYRAYVNNTYGSDVGNDIIFLTKPQPPTSLAAQANNSSIIFLTWVIGTGANTTYIERNTSSGWALGEGTEIYNGSAALYEDSGINQGTTYYYQAWSYSNWTEISTLFQWSDNNASTSNTTNNRPTCTVISPINASTNVNLQPTCEIWANDTDGDTLTVYWYENTTESWVLRQTNNSVVANSTLNWSFTQADAYGTTYWWKVAINDNVDNITFLYYFTTIPINTSVDTIIPYVVDTPPITITATNTTPAENVTLYYRWSKDNSTWGFHPMSIFEGFESGTQNTSLWNTYQTAGGDARIQWNYGTVRSGSYSCVMDDADTDTGDYALNVIYTNYDFSGASNINIDFWEREWGDEANDAPDSWTGWGNYDAVAFTNDGNTWYEIVSEASLNIETFSNFQYNISADPDFVSPANSSFAIAFQQYDNYQLTYDGRAWDDIYINFTIPVDNSTDWRKWSNVTNPDTNGGDGWSWNFDFPNSTGFYEFYSIGNLSGSTNETAPINADAICVYTLTPTISNEGPANESIDIPVYPQLNITVNDTDAYPMTITWFSNSSGPWQAFGTNTSVYNGTYHQNNSNFSLYFTTFWWYVYVTDGFKSNTSEIFHFRTEHSTFIDIIPDQWDIGATTVGNYNYSTSDFYFNLSNNGTTTLNIQIKASNATNTTTGAQWELNSTPGYDNYSLQYNKSGGGTWTNINLTYDTFVTNLDVDSWQTFDLNIFMATLSTKSDPLSVAVTFRSVIS